MAHQAHIRAVLHCIPAFGADRLLQRASPVALAAHPARWVQLRKRGSTMFKSIDAHTATAPNTSPGLGGAKPQFPHLPAYPNCETRYQREILDHQENDAKVGFDTVRRLELNMRPRKAKPENQKGLFPSEIEIARRLNQIPSQWSAKAKILERNGFPRIDPLMGGRYWPAVEAYWQRRYGLSSMDVHQPDGKENLDAL
jgi:hypothetical protein